MPTQEQFDNLHKALALTYSCSPRVIQYVRSAYAQKFKGEDFPEIKANMIDHSEKVLVEIMKSYRQVKIDFASLILRDVQNLQQSNRRILQLESEIKHITGFTDKVGFRKSIISFLKNCTDADFKTILDTRVPESQIT